MFDRRDAIRSFVACFALLALSLASPSSFAAQRVDVIATPNGGLQPQAAVDAAGVVHLVYFAGDPAAGDLFYVHRNGDAWSEPLRVNSVPASAVAIGTIRGGRIALGRDGRVHVAWNGAGKGESTTGMLYARLDDAGKSFEPQRNLMKTSTGVDGGCDVAADSAGNVFVAWHAQASEDDRGEDKRKVWIAKSTDDGRTFAAEKPAWDEPTGACACCSLTIHAGRDGALYLLYRQAKDNDRRGIVLLRSTDHGATFTGTVLDEWKVNSCPMSSASIADAKDGVVAAWENAGQIWRGAFTVKGEIAKPIALPGEGGDRKHPTIAVDAAGNLLIAWAEGTGWQRGGDLVWQFLDVAGKAIRSNETVRGGVPMWGLPGAIGASQRFMLVR